MITLRNLLKSSLASIIIISSPGQNSDFLNYPTNIFNSENLSDIEISIEDVVNNAVREAAESFNGAPYSWETGAYCSSYVARYLSILGLPVERVVDSPYQYQPSVNSPIPDSSTYMQLNWFENFNLHYGGGFMLAVYSYELQELDWRNIPIGSLIYMERAGLSQYGEDEVQHVAIFTGTNNEGVPLFSDFAAGMTNGPMTERSLTRLVLGVNGDGEGGHLFEGRNGPVHAYIIDTIGIKNFIETQFQ